MEPKLHVRNTLFHHVCVCTDTFLFCAPELPYYWFYVISLPWAKRHIIHINKKGMIFKSNKLRSTTFCLCFDKVNLPWFILEENGSLFWQISRSMPFTQNLAYFFFLHIDFTHAAWFFLSSFCTALLIFVQVVSHIAACQPIFIFCFSCFI